MIITTGNLTAKVVAASDQEMSWLRSYLAFESGDKDTPRRFVTKVRVINLDNTFPAGFLPLVQKHGPAQGVKVEVVDKRVRPCAPIAEETLPWLRSYQREAVDRVIKHVRGILWHPTGAGKTEVAVALGLLFPCNWLFLVNSNHLVNQAADRWEKRLELPAGRIGEGSWVVHRFTCATFQTLYARLKDEDEEAINLLSGAQGLIVDEAHTLPASSFWDVAMRTKAAFWRIAMSGTPLARGDRRSLLTVGATGPVIHRIKPEVLIQAGVLSRPRIRMTKIQHAPENAAWQGVYKECVVEGERRNDAVIALVKRAKKPCMVFVKEIEHGRILEKMLLRSGIQTEFVFGNNSTHEREGAIRRLVRGEYEVLVASVVFNTGIDVPELRSLVVASGGKSVISALQRVGRGMRVQKDAEGNVVKDSFEVYDFCDEGDRWLEKHTRTRMAAYQKEGYEVVVESEGSPLLL